MEKQITWVELIINDNKVTRKECQVPEPEIVTVQTFNSNKLAREYFNKQSELHRLYKDTIQLSWSNHYERNTK